MFMTPTMERSATLTRRRAIKKELLLASAFGFAFGAVLMVNVTDRNGSVMRWVNHHEYLVQRDEIAPTMIPLAKSGSADAVIWYALSYPDAPLQPLRALAAAGNPRAQWALAGILGNSDKPTALLLAKQAADAGLPDAVRYEVCATKNHCR
jgi:TPR repeat protein